MPVQVSSGSTQNSPRRGSAGPPTSASVGVESAELDEETMQGLFTWIDTIPLSRPKRNLNRDFSDAVLVAEVIHHFLPKFIDLHNYPAANSYSQKLYNWNTLHQKVFRKLNLSLSDEIVQQAASVKPGAIETILSKLMVVLPEVPQPLTSPQATQAKTGNSGTTAAEEAQNNDPVELMPESYTHLRLQHQQSQQQHGSALPPPSPGANTTQTHALSGRRPSGSKVSNQGSNQRLDETSAKNTTAMLSVQDTAGQYRPEAATQGQFSQQLSGVGGGEDPGLVQDLRETVQILSAKIGKLEQLLAIKERRIEDLQRQLAQSSVPAPPSVLPVVPSVQNDAVTHRSPGRAQLRASPERTR